MPISRLAKGLEDEAGAEESALARFEEAPMVGLLALFASSYYTYLEPPYFVGWGTLALINAGLAQGKQKSGLLWFLL